MRSPVKAELFLRARCLGRLTGSILITALCAGTPLAASDQTTTTTMRVAQTAEDEFIRPRLGGESFKGTAPTTVTTPITGAASTETAPITKKRKEPIEFDGTFMIRQERVPETNPQKDPLPGQEPLPGKKPLPGKTPLVGKNPLPGDQPVPGKPKDEVSPEKGTATGKAPTPGDKPPLDQTPIPKNH